MTAPYVVLKHNRADSPDFNWSFQAYCIQDLRHFCDNPIPPGSEYRFFGIYASKRAAFAAAQADRRLTEPHRLPEHRPFSPMGILKAMAFETAIVLLAARDLLEAGDLVLGSAEFDRLALAAERIQSALSLATGSAS